MDDQRWNLDELAERVDAALAVGYRGQPSGRVRAVPDRRAIRWYTTIGLIDRPLAYRGRTALYGPRHLLQLVAVKRLQAEGLPLVAIQQRLAGATDTQLARVAHLPPGTGPAPAPTPVLAPDGAGSRPGGAAAEGERTAGRPATGIPRVAGVPRAASRVAGGPASRRAGFWRQQPAALSAMAEAATSGAGDPTVDTDPGRAGPGDASMASPIDPETLGSGDRAVPIPGATLQGVRLGEGATLLLEPGRELDAADVRAVLAAAGPLLAALRDRGLAGPAGNPASGSRPDPGPGGGRPTQPPTRPQVPPPPRGPTQPPRGRGNQPRREQP